MAHAYLNDGVSVNGLMVNDDVDFISTCTERGRSARVMKLQHETHSGTLYVVTDSKVTTGME
eukprot:762971-Hanusia_phi.AAC.3